MNLCRLCLTAGEDLLEIFSDEGQTLNIASIISKHFWFQVLENDSQSNRLCKDCWIITNTFHTFYCEVGKKQKSYFDSVPPIKHEIDDEFQSKPSEDCDKLPECKNTSDNDSSEKNVVELEKDVEMEEPQPVRRSTRKSNPKKPKPKKERKPPAQPSKTEDPVLRKLEEKWRASYSYGKATENVILEHCGMKCVKCTDNVKFTKWLEMKKHYRDKHQMVGYVTCCDQKFSNRMRIMGHIAKHINPEVFRCHFCNKNYSEKVSLKHHMLQHKEDKPFKCNNCPKSFARIYQLTAHQVRHEEKNLACSECGKLFVTQHLLNAHTKAVHENAYMQVCEICAKVFKSKHILENHKIDVHSEVKLPKLQCQLCGTWLKNERSLRNHMSRHDQAENNTYVCTICGKKAANKQALQSHNRYVHQTERTHKCSICDKAFKMPKLLLEHMTIHTGETLYTCPYCPKTFNSNANMHSHKKKIHKQQWEENRKLKAM